MTVEAPCGWLVERLFVYEEVGETDLRVVECGAPARFTDRGFECDAGHSHVNAEYRSREGWDYAEDEHEARLLRRVGVAAVLPR